MSTDTVAKCRAGNRMVAKFVGSRSACDALVIGLKDRNAKSILARYAKLGVIKVEAKGSRRQSIQKVTSMRQRDRKKASLCACVRSLLK
jgi:hypothetical protein